ncbi:hypothetical protein BJ322DRAFT_1212853 [Thelephora terrestris]|uniref:GmrSD restriction endonucleases N-terminal domain-containing protein n=1 Tax=Thelephora terrestris TaxID=56493 RepID=A0A9P6L4W8_9AGAM|nr:hypothetical protein BJ322DRAFT_1212853 [Thelephora terrestris]
MSTPADLEFTDLSDLTELSSSDEAVPSVARDSKGKSSAKEAFVLKNTLRPPRSVSYTTKWLNDQLTLQHIDLDPEYQRDVVWPEAKQVGLIDSIFHNFYIPPIIFCVRSEEDGTEKRTCIDGKQRLTSIHRFFLGLICFKDSFTNQKHWYKQMKGKTARKLLPDKYRNLFENKTIVCIEYEGLNDDQEREMFQRVQMGMALTPAERLQAINGPFPDLIREARRLMVDNEQFSKAFRIETARARDFQSIASVAFLIAKAPSQIMPTVASLEKWLNIETGVDDTIKEDVLESFTKFISIVLNPKLSEPIKRGRLSPAEFIMICYFMSSVRKSCADEVISKAIGDLRDDVRRKHDDIRTNNKVFKTMFMFINTFRSNLVGKTTVGQRAKRKRDNTEDIGLGGKLAPQVSTPPATRRTKPAPPSTLSSQRTSQAKTTTPVTTLTPTASSRGSVVPQRSTLPQKLATSVPPPINTALNRTVRFDPLAVVEAAKLQAGQYTRQGNMISPVNSQPNPNLTRNSLISQPTPPPPPPNRPPYQPPPPPHGHIPIQFTPPVHFHNPSQYPPRPGYPGIGRQSPQLPPPTPTRDPRRPQQGSGWRYYNNS